MSDITERFKILIFETAEEYIKRTAIELAEVIRKTEEAGVCEGCGSTRHLRWIRDGEIYSCYACFYNDLDFESSVMVPIYRIDDMKDYVDEDVWDELWEEENEVI